MRTRMYGGVRGRKTKVGGKPTFVFLLLYLQVCYKMKLFILFLFKRSHLRLVNLPTLSGISDIAL